jgi:hypothetical protein
MTAHVSWGHPATAATVSITWAVGVILANFDVGVFVAGMTGISVAVSGIVYTLMTSYGRARAENYRRWLEAHGPDLEAQLAAAREQAADNAHRITEIEAERRELRAELKDAKEYLFEITAAIAQDRGITLTRTTTTELKPGDAESKT